MLGAAPNENGLDTAVVVVAGADAVGAVADDPKLNP